MTGEPTDFSYLARLVPLRREVARLDPEEGPVRDYFDEFAFGLARKRPETVRFQLGHHDEEPAGRFVQILELDGWLAGVFRLEDSSTGSVAADLLRVGSCVSVGFDDLLTVRTASGARHRVLGELVEVSLVDRSSYPGAEVVQRWVRAEASAAGNGPTSSSTSETRGALAGRSTRATSSPHTAVGEPVGASSRARGAGADYSIEDSGAGPIWHPPGTRIVRPGIGVVLEVR